MTLPIHCPCLPLPLPSCLPKMVVGWAGTLDSLDNYWYVGIYGRYDEKEVGASEASQRAKERG